MIVKELRQGLRTWVFVGAFIALQATLVMLLLISSSSGNEDAASYLFWSIIAGILVFIAPLRGFNAIAGEMKAGTLDMLLLTRLGAFRIAVGKWAALVSQSALIAISVLPYVVLRYFGGGVDLLGELRGLLLLWMLSAAVTSVAVAFSAVPSVILRTIVLLVVWWWAAMVCVGLLALIISNEEGMFFFGLPGMSGSLWIFWSLLAVVWAYGCYFVLDFGSSTIAPLASNHATRKRLISLALMLPAFGFAMLGDTEETRITALAYFAVLWGLSALDCLTESPTNAPSVFVPFVKKGLLGRLSAWFLSPGWHTGLLFHLVVTVLGLGAMARMMSGIGGGHIDYDNDLAATICAALSPITALAFALLVFRKARHQLGPFLVCSIVLGVISLLLLIMRTVSGQVNVAWLGIPTPPTAFVLGSTLQSFGSQSVVPDQFTLYGTGIAAGLVWLGWCFVKAAPHFRAMTRAMRDAASSLEAKGS